MVRSLLRPIVGLLMLSVAAPVWAADNAEPVAPSAAVAAAWAREATPRGSSATSLKVLYGSYGALQALDMMSTMQARNRGAREVNPIMGGSYKQAAATKVLMAAATMASVKVIAKKNRKAAVVMMVALNVATGAIVANNYRNAHQLAGR